MAKKVRFVAERLLEAEQRGNLSGKLLQNDDMSRSCGLAEKCYQDSAFWPFSQVFILRSIFFLKRQFIHIMSISPPEASSKALFRTIFVLTFLAKEDSI